MGVVAVIDHTLTHELDLDCRRSNKPPTEDGDLFGLWSLTGPALSWTTPLQPFLPPTLSLSSLLSLLLDHMVSQSGVIKQEDYPVDLSLSLSHHGHFQELSFVAYYVVKFFEVIDKTIIFVHGIFYRYIFRDTSPYQHQWSTS